MRAEGFARGQSREVWAVAFARVIDLVLRGAEGVEEGLDVGDQGLDWREGVALLVEIASWRAD